LKNKEIEYDVSQIMKAVEYFGSSVKLARAIEVRELSVYNWIHGRSIPDPINCLKIQKVTNGQVKARDIRPNYEWDKII